MSDNSESNKIVHVHLPKGEPLKTTLTAGRHELTADEPMDVPNGQDLGPDPYDYLLMALGSCTVMTMKMYAGHKGWELGDIFVELRHNKKHVEDCKNCKDPKSRMDVIEKEIIIKGDLDQKQLDRLIDISKKCPVHRTLLSDISIETSLG
ncbi:OsmC family protein [Balneola sp. MJW-20]|uniref:OsmC family protein n=1 Tax=Gracilimonas aurantiaca TaxID=3234185 RepID=UPI0034665436